MTVCRERGHASHTVDGEPTGVCPRCGEVVELPAAETPAAPVIMASTVLASDFSRRLDDVLRDRWTLAKMQVLIAALPASTTVLVTVDKQTGHALAGVRLVTAYVGAWGNRVRVDAGRYGVTDYRLDDVGPSITILDESIEGGRAKWAALDAWRVLQSQAIAAAQAWHGDGREWGSWTATPIEADVVDVRYTPNTGGHRPAGAGEPGTRWAGRVHLGKDGATVRSFTGSGA